MLLGLLLVAQQAPAAPPVQPAAVTAAPFDGADVFERVLRRIGLSAEGARLIARDQAVRLNSVERRQRERALADRLFVVSTAPVLDLEALAKLMRERDALGAEFARRDTTAMLATLAALSPSDRKLIAPLLVRNRSGIIPVAPPAPPPPPTRPRGG